MHYDPSLAVRLAAAYMSYLVGCASIDECVKLVPDSLPEFWTNLANELQQKTQEVMPNFPPKK